MNWDGNTYLCPQDWQRRVSLGNIMQKSFFDIWKGNILNKFRKKLIAGDSNINLCKTFNADGQVYDKKNYERY